MSGLWTPTRAVPDSKLTLRGGLSSSLGGYSLLTDEVDVTLARALYRNTDARYKLGAGFARPALNIPVGFMGVPRFVTENPDDQETLDDSTIRWTANLLRAHLALLRDGEVLLRCQPGNRSPAYEALHGADARWVDLTYSTANTFEVRTLETDVLAITGFRLTHLVTVNRGTEAVPNLVVVKLWETWTAEEVRTEWEGKYLPDRTEPNPWGFVPAVYVKNAGEENDLHGHSELEPLEPYMRFYHDVMLHAGAASQLHSTAKLIVRVSDVERFLENNFTEAEIADNALRFKDKDVLFFEDDASEYALGAGRDNPQGAEIIQADAPLGDTNTLLEYVFLNVVDVSEVPEWAFGGAIASSKASVTEQSAPLVHKVERKRELTRGSWELVGRMALAMMDRAARVTVQWDDLAIKDVKYEAEAFKTRSEAWIELVQGELVSRSTAVDDLRPWSESIRPYLADVGEDEATLIAQERVKQALAVLDQMDADERRLLEQEGNPDEQPAQPDQLRPVR